MKVFEARLHFNTAFVSNTTDGAELKRIAAKFIQEEIEQSGISMSEVEVSELKLPTLPKSLSGVVPWGTGSDDGRSVKEILLQENSCHGKIVEIEGKKYKLSLVES